MTSSLLVLFVFSQFSPIFQCYIQVHQVIVLPLELQLSPLSSVRCLALPEQEQPLAGQERLKVRLGPVLFLCRPDPGLELAGNSKFEVDSLDRQFSDEAGHLVISSSCRGGRRSSLSHWPGV